MFFPDEFATLGILLEFKIGVVKTKNIIHKHGTTDVQTLLLIVAKLHQICSKIFSTWHSMAVKAFYSRACQEI